MVISSPEKTHSHELINKVLFKWISFHLERRKYSQVITMPASSGVQENQILAHIDEHAGFGCRWGNPITLHTFDNRFNAEETNVNAHDYWIHHKCTDVFRKMIKLSKLDHEEKEFIAQAPTAAWFDLCGGLTDGNYHGMQQVVDEVFVDGSLLFTTLAIDVVRGLSKESIAGSMYSRFKPGVLRRKIATDMLLCEMAEDVGKYLSPVFEPYVYRRNNAPSSYAVFGYIVGKK